MRKFKGIEVDENKVQIEESGGAVIICDENDNVIYDENSSGYWRKWEFDENNNRVYFEDSNGYYISYIYDEHNNQVYYERRDGYWEKREFDGNHKQVYYENSLGAIKDKRKKK